MNNYIVSLTLFTATYAIFSLGLNLQWGYTGLINFGHVAFMTIGAYTTVLLSTNGVPLFFAVLAGGGLAALLGLLVGISTLRLREDYLGIVTIGISELIRLIAQNEGWLTKGSFGIQGYPLPLDFTPTYFTKIAYVAILTVVFGGTAWSLWKWSRQAPQRWWQALLAIGAAGVVYVTGAMALYSYDNSSAGLMLLAVVTLAIIYVGLEKLVVSPWGRVLKAIREDEEVPKALGKNVFWYKLQALMLGGGIAGIAGAFYAWTITSIYPTNFEPLMTFNAWTIVMLGGAGNNVGVILGAVIFWTYDTITRNDVVIGWLADNLHLSSDKIGALRVMIIGLILMLIMMWRPQGILGDRNELTLGK